MSFEKPWGNYLLEKMVETTAPDSISFWPQTIAWQIIAVIVILISIKKCYQLWRTYKNNAYRREALAWLKQCSLTNENDIRQLPTLLRKTALLANAVSKNTGLNLPDASSKTDTMIIRQSEITQLIGIPWAEWLDKHCPKSEFSKSLSPISSSILLKELAYSPTLKLDDKQFNNALLLLCKQITLWVKYHQLHETSPTNNEGETA